MEPLLARAREIMLGDDPPRDQLRALVRLWVANVIEYRDHMLVFQQERHAIESGAQWRARPRQPQGLRAPRRARPRGGRRDRAGGRSTSAWRWSRCWAWSTTPRSGTSRAGASRPDEIADGYLSLLLRRAPARRH